MKKFLVLLILCGMFLLSGLMPACAETSADGAPPAVEAVEEPYTGIFTVSSMLMIGLVAAVMAGGLMLSKRRVRWSPQMIAKAAVCMALAYVLSMIKIFRMPQGGSVTLISLLPLILFAVAYGPLEGLLVGFAYGLLQLLIDPYVIHPVQLLVDYPIAFGAVALACSGAKLPLHARLKLPMAVLSGYFGRYVMAVLSGVVFFAEYAGDQGALTYSLVYNIGYLGVEALMCAAVALAPGMHRLPAVLRDGR